MWRHSDPLWCKLASVQARVLPSLRGIRLGLALGILLAPIFFMMPDTFNNAVPEIAAYMHSDPVATSEWPASLSGRFQRDRNGQSQLVRLSHQGPLRVQRVFQTPAWAECYLLHPPGGLVSGDSLDVHFAVAEGAAALITTPASGKVYGARLEGGWQESHVDLNIEARGGLAWLPQDTICFDRARVRQSIRVAVASSGWHVGWEQITFGRQAAAAPFQTGQFNQSLCVVRDGVVRYQESMTITPEVLASPAGLSGRPVMALMWLVLPVGSPIESAVAYARGLEADPVIRVGATAVSSELCLVRVLGQTAAPVRTFLEQLWSAWTPLCVDQTIQPPRIWRT